MGTHPVCKCNTILSYGPLGTVVACPTCGRRWRNEVPFRELNFEFDPGDIYLEEITQAEDLSRYYNTSGAMSALGLKPREFWYAVSSGIVPIGLKVNGQDYFLRELIDELADYMRKDPRDFWICCLSGEILPCEDQLLTSHLAARMIRRRDGKGHISQKRLVQLIKENIISGQRIGYRYFANRGSVEEYAQRVGWIEIEFRG